jgi:transcriptional regulator with GAF, ATPase, and Fis domain
VPRELFESEFFGHVRGAFSGAARDRQGRFLLADGGSLFLDEVGEIPLEQQGKLLRVLQEQTFEPVGDDRTRRVDVRVIAATNRPLEHEVECGRFRRDLYYRLSVVPIVVPPLRERRDDILPMARHFLGHIARRLHVPVRTLSARDEQLLEQYDFPGNVRELQNVLERAMVLAGAEGDELRLELRRPHQPSTSPPASSTRFRATESRGFGLRTGPADDEVLEESSLRELERSNVLRALTRCDWRIAGERGAARLLGLSPSTLAYRMKQLGIERPR